MRNTILPMLACFFLQALSAPAFAQTPAPPEKPVRFLVRTAFEFGGDEVAKVYFTNGNTQSVRAGQGGTLALGAQFAIPGAPKLLFHSTVGIKYVTTAADNAHIRLTRIPLHLTANWLLAPKFRAGAGIVTHRNIQFKADNIGRDVQFNGATGPVFELAYGVVGLSYTAMKYQDQFGETYKANAFGLTISYAVPGKKKKTTTVEVPVQ